METCRYTRNVIRGVSVFFNEAAVNDVLKRLNCTLIVRAHQMMMNGLVSEGEMLYEDQTGNKSIDYLTFESRDNLNKRGILVLNKTKLVKNTFV